MLSSKELAAVAAKALDSKMAKDVKVLRTSDLTVLADYFVIATATSTTHVKTLSDAADKALSELGEPPLRREGYRSDSWVLLDFGCVVVHIFMKEAREFYNLERLWGDAEEVTLSSL